MQRIKLIDVGDVEPILIQGYRIIMKQIGKATVYGLHRTDIHIYIYTPLLFTSIYMYWYTIIYMVYTVSSRLYILFFNLTPIKFYFLNS